MWYNRQHTVQVTTCLIGLVSGHIRY